MKKISCILFWSLLLSISFCYAQKYSIVIKGGHVIDAKNRINEVIDVAILNGKIAALAKNIDINMATQYINAAGMYVTPGLIDLHAHVFAGTEPDHEDNNGFDAVAADGFTFRAGVTTVVDCGGPGWKSFATFKRNIIDQSKTRVLSFLNINGEGMKGVKWEQNLDDMDSKRAADMALANKEYIVGFKLAHWEGTSWIPVERAIEAGNLANLPIIVDFGGSDAHPPLSIEILFDKYFRPGDIFTHVFTELKRRDPIVDLNTRKLKPFVLSAQKRGIIFDVGFGAGSFNFNQAVPAFKAGFLPNTMGTDLHIGSMNASMKDELNVLSTFLAIGMNLQDLIARSTWAPAQAISREELGNLSVGAIADIAILTVREGKFGFRDIDGNRMEGKQRLECEMTIKGGQIVYDLNAIASNPTK
ncbi:MAG: amidohydrolase/deacetylase family metallohydrolase [Ginsengibacter sp.]